MKISDRQRKTYNHFLKVQSSLNELFSMTRTFQLNFEEYLKLKDQKYFQHPSLPKLTRYYKGMSDGIELTLFNILQNEWVEWIHYYTDSKGNAIYTKKWEDFPIEIRYEKTNQIKSNHFWKNPKDINNPKPWGIE